MIEGIFYARFLPQEGKLSSMSFDIILPIYCVLIVSVSCIFITHTTHLMPFIPSFFTSDFVHLILDIN